LAGSESKTEKASSKRRQDERKKGNVLISKDVIAIVSLIGSFYTLKSLFPMMIRGMQEVISYYFELAGTQEELTESVLADIARNMIFSFFKIAFPVIMITLLLSVVATVAQTKPMFVMDSLKPKFSRMNPLKGIKNMFSFKSAFDVLKGIFKISILIFILYHFIEDSMLVFARTIDMDIYNSILILLDLIMGLVFKIVLAFIAISVFDYFFQWWDYERQIKMSKKEMKEEYKQMEGDPQVKGKIKDIQRKMAMSRMMQSVPEADVVIKNPTHYAVALKYDAQKQLAPILVAKGQDLVALRIIEKAEELDIFVLENVPLARAIYATTQLNGEIPEEFYGTVAEILVYVYKLKNKDLF